MSYKTTFQSILFMLCLVFIATASLHASQEDVVEEPEVEEVTEYLTYLPIVPVPNLDPTTCQYPINYGFGIIEFENIRHDTNQDMNEWVHSRTRDGYSQDGYIYWSGPEKYGTPGYAPLSYRLVVEEAGTYQVRIHGHHNGATFDGNNDIWIWTSHQTSPRKLYSSAQRKWGWHTMFDVHGGDNHPSEFYFPAGEHELIISARSQNFFLDKVVLGNERYYHDNGHPKVDLYGELSTPCQ